MLQLLEKHGKEAPVSIRKLDTVEAVLKESDVSPTNHQCLFKKTPLACCNDLPVDNSICGAFVIGLPA